MKRGVPGCMAALLLFATGAGVAAPVSIELLPQARRAGLVKLGHVARIASDDLQLVRRLVEVPVAHLRAHAVQIGRERLARRLARELRGSDAMVDWRGAPAVSMEPALQALPPGAVVEAASAELGDWLRRPAERVHFSVDAAPRLTAVPDGALRLQARAIPAGLLPRSRMVVWVDASVDGRHVRSVPVRFRVASQRIGVAGPAVPAGESVRGSGRREEADVAALGAGLAAPPKGDALLRKPVRKGDALGRSDVERAPLVARGRWASLHSRTGAVEIRTRVEVLQDGWAGDRVRVRPAPPAAALVATVLGPGELEVQR